MIADLAEVRRALQPAENSPETTSIQRVCDAVEDLLAPRTLASDPNPTCNV
jgi:hypothetical protein